MFEKDLKNLAARHNPRYRNAEKSCHSITISHPVVSASQVAWTRCAHGYLQNSQILYGELSEGTRNVGQPNLCFKDQYKTSMMEFSVKHLGTEPDQA